jgi:hypothetical protein
MVELHLHSPIRLHGVVPNYLNIGTTLPLPFILQQHEAGRFSGSSNAKDKMKHNFYCHCSDVFMVWCLGTGTILHFFNNLQCINELGYCHHYHH